MVKKVKKGLSSYLDDLDFRDELDAIRTGADSDKISTFIADVSNFQKNQNCILTDFEVKNRKFFIKSQIQLVELNELIQKMWVSNPETAYWC